MSGTTTGARFRPSRWRSGSVRPRPAHPRPVRYASRHGPASRHPAGDRSGPVRLGLGAPRRDGRPRMQRPVHHAHQHSAVFTNTAPYSPAQRHIPAYSAISPAQHHIPHTALSWRFRRRQHEDRGLLEPEQPPPRCLGPRAGIGTDAFIPASLHPEPRAGPCSCRPWPAGAPLPAVPAVAGPRRPPPSILFNRRAPTPSAAGPRGA